MVIGPNILPDGSDLDADASTNNLVGINFLGTMGNWPSPSATADDVFELAEITFEKVDGGNTNYIHDYSASSQPPAYYEFIAEPSLPAVPLSVNTQDIDENSGEGQTIATVEGGPANATYSLDDNTNYGDQAGAEEDQETVITVPDSQPLTAHAYVSATELSDDGSQLTVTVSYLSDTLATGIGLNIHFDSSALSLVGSPAVTSHGAMVIGPNTLADGNDSDADANTDILVGINFLAMAGGWPGNTGSVELATLTFDVIDASVGSTAINFSQSLSLIHI